MKGLLLVDTPEAVACGLAAQPDALLASDNPHLVDEMAVRGACHDIDRHITAADADRLGLFSVEMAKLVDARLAGAPLLGLLGFNLQHFSIASLTVRLFASLTYRSVALSRCLRVVQPERIAIAAVDDQPPAGVPMIFMERFQSPWPRLARQGFFGDVPWTGQAMSYTPPKNLNDTRSGDTVRRFALMPMGALLGWGALKLGISKALAVCGRPAVLIESDNELIREVTGELLLKGIGVIPVAHGAGKPLTAAVRDRFEAEIYPQVSEILQVPLAQAYRDLGELSECESVAVAKLAAWHIAGGLLRLSMRLPMLQAEIDAARRQLKSDVPALVLVNGLYGGEGSQYYSHCRERGVTVVNFEHGVTTGLSCHSESKISFSEVTNCDVMFVSSEAAAKSFRRGSVKTRVVPCGLSDQTRKMHLPEVQRSFARRSLGLKGQKPVAMHIVTAPLQGNWRAGPFAYAERDAIEINRRLIRDVYAQSPDWTVVFKDYPTQRFPYEKSCDDYTGGGENIVFASNEDFRYVRAAADILITTMPTSTLGWCAGTGRPLIWIESPVTPLLNDDQRRLFSEAFFVVDAGSENWTAALRELLHAGLPALQREWQRKRDARRAVLENYIMGPPGRAAAVAAGEISRLLSSQG